MHRAKLQQFLRDYANTTSYWYVPKARALNDDNTVALKGVLKVISEEFEEVVWDADTQELLLDALIREGLLEPRKPGADPKDANALVRIWKKWLETLGLMWVDPDTSEILLTPAATSVLSPPPPTPRDLVEAQITKIQFPNPGLDPSYRNEFEGLLPLLFLLQVMQRTGYRISRREYELFVNLAQKQDDLDRIVGYIKAWRDLTADEKDRLATTAAKVKIPHTQKSRANRVHLNTTYQLGLYTYPSYLTTETVNRKQFIVCTATDVVDEVIETLVPSLAIIQFDSMPEWIAYLGDPDQRPDWATFLSENVEKAASPEAAEELVKAHKKKLAPAQQQEIERKQLEKAIETFYVDALHVLEEGLTLVEGGRQYQTPIGRMDLLCRGADDKYVVVEVKVDEAKDAVFGQVLRYMGWVHRNLPDGEGNVRAIVLAGGFGETARYSRIGLLADDYKERIKFKQHGLNPQEV